MIFGIGTVFCHVLYCNILINMLKNIIDSMSNMLVNCSHNNYHCLVNPDYMDNLLCEVHKSRLFSVCCL